VLQEREFERLGSTRTRRVDVRVVAATNRPLDEMVAAGAFRRDLYYRLNVFPITLPPLRERTDDIPRLVRYFVQKLARSMNKRIESVSVEAMEALERYSWPGNVRELENAIERAVILTSNGVLEVPSLEFPAGTVLAPRRNAEATERKPYPGAARGARGRHGPDGAVSTRPQADHPPVSHAQARYLARRSLMPT
jgi:formate hydrogenlyase transcriptional activator